MTEKDYAAPEVTEYGAVESVTEQSNKVGTQNDNYSESTPLVGSVVGVGDDNDSD